MQRFCPEPECQRLLPEHEPDCNKGISAEDIIQKFKNNGIDRFIHFTHPDNINLIQQYGIISKKTAKDKYNKEIKEFRNTEMVQTMKTNFEAEEIGKYHEFDHYAILYFTEPDYIMNSKTEISPSKVCVNLDILRDSEARQKMIMINDTLYSPKDNATDQIYYRNNVDPQFINWNNTTDDQTSIDKHEYATGILISKRTSKDMIIKCSE